MISDGGLDAFALRGRVFIGVVLMVMGVLMIRLVQLQVIDASVYTGESRTNAIREKRVLPARGTVRDRNGRLIVDNEPSYTVLVTPRYFDESNVPLLADILEVPQETVSDGLARATDWNHFRPSALLRGVTFDRVARLMERRSDLPGIAFEVSQKRRYVSDARASHVLGYVREITRRDLDSRAADGYRAGDVIGIAGVERVYEDALRGSLGSAFRLVNVHGQDVEAFKGGSEDVDPVAGYDLHLSIDLDLQTLAESLFVGKRGSAVALDPASGEILALVSKPDFDLDMLSRPMSEDTWEWFTSSPEKPQFNRATQSELMPGSTWKPFMAMVALQQGVITPTTRIDCNGGHPIGRGRFFKCMHRHGSIDVTTAIQESCNTFFFEMMRRVDVNSHARLARSLGFGRRTELDLTEQVSGLIPDSAYYDRTYPDGWTVGYQMNLGVGQGNLGVTPLQLARYAAAVGNGGRVYTPHVVRALVNVEDGTRVEPQVAPPSRLPIDPVYVDIAREGMRRVMTEGTGKWIQIPGIPSGGKTGTAENPRGKDDSVFIMFAPYDNPQIALAVLVENAGFGGTAAGPIASLMAEQYLTGDVSDARGYLLSAVMERTSDPLPTVVEE